MLQNYIFTKKNLKLHFFIIDLLCISSHPVFFLIIWEQKTSEKQKNPVAHVRLNSDAGLLLPGKLWPLPTSLCMQKTTKWFILYILATSLKLLGGSPAQMMKSVLHNINTNWSSFSSLRIMWKKQKQQIKKTLPKANPFTILLCVTVWQIDSK